MAAGKSVDLAAPAGAIEQAVVDGDYAKARKKITVKLARMMDATDSARDAKSISLSLIQLIDKCEADAARAGAEKDTPLAQILAEAEAALANV